MIACGALKMILPGPHAGSRELARFRMEAEAIARLQHPNIVQIYEVGEAAGHPFFSLEFVAGGNLEDKLSGTPLPARDAAQLVHTLARAVHAAHERGTIHRDLKPANIYFNPTGRRSVRLRYPRSPTSAWPSGWMRPTGRPTAATSWVPLAPDRTQQARGEIKEVGAAADIYALGAILYELLTGRPPFEAATSWDTIQQVITAEPVRPKHFQPDSAQCGNDLLEVSGKKPEPSLRQCGGDGG